MKAHQKKKLGRRLKKSILDLFISERGKVLNYKQVSARLNENEGDVRHFIHELMDMLVAEDALVLKSPGRYTLSPSFKRGTEGSIHVDRRGRVSFIPEDMEVDEGLEVDVRRSVPVLHGDLCRAVIKRAGKREKARIEEVLERKERHYVGILDVQKSYAFFKADDPTMHVDIFIDLDKLGKAKAGDKVLVAITDWPETAASPFGKVLDVLGQPGKPQTEMNSILHEFGLPPEFPAEVLSAAGKIGLEIPKAEIKRRKDMRSICTFTIDPADAKDFDDAISLEKAQDGSYSIGVHIADVTHYVQRGGIIDEEAVNRATSVYLADRVVPMLPEVLSNLVCSLRPHEEKLCYSVIFRMDKDSRVLDHEICRTVIYSDRRFTYEEAQERIESGQGDFAKEINVLDSLAKRLRKDRQKEGSFEFHSQELRFIYDDEGDPVDTVLKVMKDANQLVEEFMLLANRYVARSIKKSKPFPPFIFRNHDLPDVEKLFNLRTFLKSVGLRFNTSTADVRGELRKLLASAKDHPQSALIQQMVIRTMSKADYGVNNIGHYGLAFEDYTHFTSPIRRYPDVLVHRLLAAHAKGEKGYTENELARLARHCSLQERKAVEAERTSIKFMQAYYLRMHIGKVFKGRISGVTNFGMFVVLEENHCEGLVMMHSMDDDHYRFDQDAQKIVGRKHKDTYRIGDVVEVRVTGADPIKRQVDLVLV